MYMYRGRYITRETDTDRQADEDPNRLKENV